MLSKEHFLSLDPSLLFAQLLKETITFRPYIYKQKFADIEIFAQLALEGHICSEY